MRAAFAAGMALAVLASCRTVQTRQDFTPVSDADFGRLGPDQLGPVGPARADAAAAHDAVARAKLRLQEAKREQGYAEADRTAAEADLQRAATEAKGANSAGDTAWKARAQALADTAGLRRQAADAHLVFAKRLAEARQADVDAAEAHADAAQARLEQAKLQALARAGIPAAGKYDARRFDAHLAKAVAAEREAQARAGETGRAAVAAEDGWRALQRRWEARSQGRGGTG
ncbi:conserved hypothetical protein [Anaeromyxobacter dehalogenans 2CP-1]|uniref:Uncharacterized protein n=1 Tax=Anaeromyxobacter dehalogenans (strain ATCC BAA-258 / DSM 21875 / 2CP-1) TaxID=455488 RepID=B8J8Y6_ANAD2|nr:hypothetical protein [Anaeromyxobacter dehalogenans]ACL63584.1 conserved hypothetical protein [Anaeromyxobacter dehalogenans 2CP-1]